MAASGTVPGVKGWEGRPNGWEGQPPRAPTLSLGRQEAHGLAPLAPGALVALLLIHGVLRGGHLDTQPGLIGGTRVQFSSLEGEPGHPNNVTLVPGTLGVEDNQQLLRVRRGPPALEDVHTHTEAHSPHACAHGTHIYTHEHTHRHTPTLLPACSLAHAHTNTLTTLATRIHIGIACEHSHTSCSGIPQAHSDTDMQTCVCVHTCPLGSGHLPSHSPPVSLSLCGRRRDRGPSRPARALPPKPPPAS